MKNKEILKRKIIYRSTHRGTKEMDILLGAFVKKYINKLTDNDLEDLKKIILLEDEVLYNWYIAKINIKSSPKNKVSRMLKDFKL